MKLRIIFAALLIPVLLAACGAPEVQPRQAGSEETAQMTEPEETFTVPPETDIAQIYTDGPEIAELVSLSGETTTVYKLADGRYMDRIDRIFEYDGGEDWLCTDGSVWNLMPESQAVSVEFAIERLLNQRSDYAFYDDAPGSEYAGKVVITALEPITNFSYLKLGGEYDDNGQFTCTEFETLFSLDGMTENDLTVINMVFTGLLPDRGIAFTDAFGNNRLYWLTLSGEDNVPLLIRLS